MKKTPDRPDEGAEHIAIGRLAGDARQARGLTQTDAARRLGMTQSKLAKIETGERRLYLRDAIAMAGLYGVDLSAFDPRSRPARPRTGVRRARVKTNQD